MFPQADEIMEAVLSNSQLTTKSVVFLKARRARSRKKHQLVFKIAHSV